MKWLLLVLSSVLVAFSNADNKEMFCYNKDDSKLCSSADGGGCSALFPGFHVIDLQSYANHQIEKSYEYLLLAANFGTYNKNRPGFAKQFRALADRAWDSGLDLIKHITKRGEKHNFKISKDVVRKEHEAAKANTVLDPSEYTKQSKDKQTLDLNEIQALALTLDYEKTLARDAHFIHQKYSHRAHDSEIAHYIEEKFLGVQVDTIRKLSGYVNDLKNILSRKEGTERYNNNGDISFAYYFFDEYLVKQE